jgi:phage protein U
MAKIGGYGEVIFEVTPSSVHTFENFARSGSARWAEHDILLHKSRPEFLGPGLEEISFNMKLSAYLGINPATSLAILRRMRDEGEVSPLIIGNAPISDGYWLIDSISEDHTHYDNFGNLLQATIEVHMKEYPKVFMPSNTRIKSNTTTSNHKKSKYIGDVSVHVKSVNIRSGPSLSAKVVGWAMRGDAYRSYGKVTTDIEWFVLGGGKYITAGSEYVSLKKGG